MPKTRREFSPEFKRETVALLETSGRPLMQVATELGISLSMLRNWRAVIRGGAARPRPAAPGVAPLPSLADQASEIARLKRELDRTRRERDVLKTRSASSRRCRDELQIHPRSRQPLAGPADVPGSRGLGPRLSRVARPPGERAIRGDPQAARRYPSSPWRASWPLRHPPPTFHRCFPSMLRTAGTLAGSAPGCMPGFARKAGRRAVVVSSG